MSFNNTDVGGAGVSLVNGTKITVENTGIYNLQFSSQFNRTNSGTDTITIWFAYTGSSVANSATDVVLTGGASVNATVASWNYVLPMSASSYVQIYWSTPDTHVEMSTVGTRTLPTRPAVPSIIATLTQIA
jgi:archaellum component FlaF (FlaF/FlaG flagellin family)